MELGEEFLDMTPKKKKKISKLDFIKTKNFGSDKDSVKRMKREITDRGQRGGEILVNPIPVKGLVPKHIKMSLTSAIIKQAVQLEFRQKP